MIAHTHGIATTGVDCSVAQLSVAPSHVYGMIAYENASAGCGVSCKTTEFI